SGDSSNVFRTDEFGFRGWLRRSARRTKATVDRRGTMGIRIGALRARRSRFEGGQSIMSRTARDATKRSGARGPRQPGAGVWGGTPSRKSWRGTESNWRHYDFQSYALPTELPRHLVGLSIISSRPPRSQSRHVAKFTRHPAPGTRHPAPCLLSRPRCLI